VLAATAALPTTSVLDSSPGLTSSWTTPTPYLPRGRAVVYERDSS
jgi:hypothetical protein